MLVVIRRRPTRLPLYAERPAADCARSSNEEIPSGGSLHGHNRRDLTPKAPRKTAGRATTSSGSFRDTADGSPGGLASSPEIPVADQRAKNGGGENREKRDL